MEHWDQHGVCHRTGAEDATARHPARLSTERLHLQNGGLTHGRSFAPSAHSEAFVTDPLLVCAHFRDARHTGPLEASPGRSHPGALCLRPVASLARALRPAPRPAPGLPVLSPPCGTANLRTPRTLPGMENGAAAAGNNQDVPQLPREPAIPLLGSIPERTKNIFIQKLVQEF